MLQIISSLKIGRTYLVGDSGDHASDHTALSAGDIVTYIVLNSLAHPLLAHVAHGLSHGGADLVHHMDTVLLLRVCVVSLHPHLPAAKVGTVLGEIQHLVVDVGIKGSNLWPLFVTEQSNNTSDGPPTVSVN